MSDLHPILAKQLRAFGLREEAAPDLATWQRWLASLSVWYRESGAAQRAVLETLQDGILVVSPDRRVLITNRRFRELWRIPEELIARADDQALIAHVVSALRDPDEFVERVAYLYEHPDERSQDIIELADGRVFDRYSAPIVTPEGPERGRMWLFRDVTAERRAVKERLRHRDETTAMIVHDLKNPLAALIANLEFVRGGAPGPATTEALDDAELAARRLCELVDQLADTERLSASRLVLSRHAVDVRDLIASALAPRRWHAVRRGIQLAVDAPDAEWIVADGALLVRVIENIVDNAFRYTPAGGRIAITVEPRGARVVLRLGNTGPPVAPELREVIFEKYQQAAEASGRGANLGLGLYFSRVVLEAHGGRIHVEETAELPCVFVIEVPREPS